MPDILYHCVPHDIEGDEIRASIGYGSMPPAEVAAQLGIAPGEKIPLVFASDHQSKALAFSFSYARGEIGGNATLEDGCEFAIVTNREQTMNAPRSGTMYSFSADNFVQLCEQQFVSPLPVPLSRTQEVMKIKSTDDLMRAGLQILSYVGNIKQLQAEREQISQKIPGGDWYTEIAAMVQSGQIVWENQARNINPHPAMKKELETSTARLMRVMEQLPVAQNKAPDFLATKKSL